jgi:hypothetical protein
MGSSGRPTPSTGTRLNIWAVTLTPTTLEVPPDERATSGRRRGSPKDVFKILVYSALWSWLHAVSTEGTVE